jgi:hypothetical protein
MPDPGVGGVGFRLTPRQRRLRVVTAVILTVVVCMVGVGMKHPFFHRLAAPPVQQLAREAYTAKREHRLPRPEAARASRVVKLKLLTIYLYWTAFFLLASSLFVIAWLDIREVERQLASARRDIWRQAGSPPPDAPRPA